jgi:hypothetical protein
MEFGGLNDAAVTTGCAALDSSLIPMLVRLRDLILDVSQTFDRFWGGGDVSMYHLWR